MSGRKWRRMFQLAQASLIVPSLFAATRQAGKVLGVTVSESAVDLRLEAGAVGRVEFVDTDIVRVRLSPTGQLSQVLTGAIPAPLAPLPAVEILDNPDGVVMQSAKALVTISKLPFQVTILRPDKSVVSEDLPGGVVWDTDSGQIACRKVAQAREAYFGLGARGGPINRRGRVIAMQNTDSDGYGEFSDPLYISIPFFYGLLDGNAYGLFFDNPATPIFDMDSAGSGVLTFGAAAGEINYYVMVGPEPADVARAYARLTGTTPLPPRWTLGYHQSRYSYDSQQVALELAAKFRSLRIPCDALWFDIDYMDKFQALTWNRGAFPSPDELFRTLGLTGFHSVFIIEPLLLTDDQLWPAARQLGHFVRNLDGTPVVTSIWYGDVSFIDFTNPAARAWYRSLLSNFLALGVDAVWNDLNEPAQSFMPYAVYDYYGQLKPDVFARNLYGLHQLSLTYETMRALRPNVRPWAISRSGYSGIQRYSANWSGDTLSTFDSLRVSLQMSISMGISGQNFFGHDIGGFLGSPGAELFLRWMEFGSYIPLFRNHANQDSAAREPWAFGEATTSIVREIIHQRYRMLPYIYTLFQEASISGRPVVAPLFFDFPQDINTYSRDDSFLLGPSLLVAPVTTEGAVRRDVYLPRGVNWIDYYSDRVYLGGTTVNVEAPLHRIPVFVREGAIIPGGPVLQHVGEDPEDRSLYLDFYRGSALSSYVLYEDDGKSFDYLGDKYLQTEVGRAEEAGYVVARTRRMGANWRPPARFLWMTFHGMPSAPSRVYSAEQQLPQKTCPELRQYTGWCHQPDTRKLIVRVPDQEQVLVALIPAEPVPLSPR